MIGSRKESLELQRAHGGSDLWVALEAAQYAKLVDHDDPLTGKESERMLALVGFFEDCSENWEQRTVSDQTIALEQLGCRVEALREIDLHVYSAVARLGIETAVRKTIHIPLAVLNISRQDYPSITVMLPRAVDLG